MRLPIVPDNQEIIALLAAHVTGPYRFVHHVFTPYVRVAPATAGTPIEIRSGAQLRLMRPEHEMKRLSGLDTVLDFAILFEGNHVALQELGRRAVALDSIDPQHPMSQRPLPGTGMPRRALHLGTPPVDAVPEGESMAPPPVPTPKPATRSRRVVVPEPPPAVEAPTELPAWLAELCQREDVHFDQGDYLVLPVESVLGTAGLERWVGRSPRVRQIHLVQPRLGRDLAVEEP